MTKVLSNIDDINLYVFLPFAGAFIIGLFCCLSCYKSDSDKNALKTKLLGNLHDAKEYYGGINPTWRAAGTNLDKCEV